MSADPSPCPTIAFPVIAATPYWVFADGASGSAETYALDIHLGAQAAGPVRAAQ